MTQQPPPDAVKKSDLLSAGRIKLFIRTTKLSSETRPVKSSFTRARLPKAKPQKPD